MPHELHDRRQGHTLGVQDVGEAGSEPMVCKARREPQGLGCPLDVPGRQMPAMRLSTSGGANEADRVRAGLELFEPGQHRLGNWNDWGIAILGFVGNEHLLGEPKSRPLHEPCLMVTHAH